MRRNKSALGSQASLRQAEIPICEKTQQSERVFSDGLVKIDQLEHDDVIYDALDAENCTVNQRKSSETSMSHLRSSPLRTSPIEK